MNYFLNLFIKITKEINLVRCIAGMEISAASQRALIAMLQFVGWTSGMCVMPMIAWATGGEWKLFMIITSLPCAIVFLSFRSVSINFSYI